MALSGARLDPLPILLLKARLLPPKTQYRCSSTDKSPAESYTELLKPDEYLAWGELAAWPLKLHAIFSILCGHFHVWQQANFGNHRSRLWKNDPDFPDSARSQSLVVFMLLLLFWLRSVACGGSRSCSDPDSVQEFSTMASTFP